MKRIVIIILLLTVCFNGCHSMEANNSNEPILSQHISSAGFVVTRFSSSCQYFQMSMPKDIHLIGSPLITTIIFADILTIDVSGENSDAKHLFIIGQGAGNKNFMVVFTLSLIEHKYTPIGHKAFEIGLSEDIQTVALISKTASNKYMLLGSLHTSHFITIADPRECSTISSKQSWPFLPIHSSFFRDDYLYCSLLDAKQGGGHQIHMKVDDELSSNSYYGAFVHGGTAFYVPYPRYPDKPLFRFSNNIIEAVKLDAEGDIISYAPNREWILTTFPVNRMAGSPIYHHDSLTLLVHYQLPNKTGLTCCSFTFSSDLSKKIIARQFENLPIPEIELATSYYFALPGYLKFISLLGSNTSSDTQLILIKSYNLNANSMKKILASPHTLLDCTFDSYSSLNPTIKNIIPLLL